jgi:hypothetical protein
MTAEDAGLLCEVPEIDISIEGLSLDFPGGISIQGVLQGDFALALDAARAMMGQANAALVPLGPIFLLVQIAVDLLAVVQAIPGSLGPPPNPTKLIAKIEKLAKDVDAVIGITPPLAIPHLVKTLLRAIILFLTGLRNELQTLLTFEADINLSVQRSAFILALPDGVGIFASAQLDLSIGCAKATLTAQLGALGQGMGPLQKLIALLNGFMQAAGLNALPDVSAIDSTSIGVNIGPLNDTIQALTIVENALP